MPARKIQDEQEIIRWFDDGWTYPQMVMEYRRKYGIETTPTLFANFRARRGLEMRNVRNAALIPWQVEPAHRFAYPLSILRWEAQVREGRALSPSQAMKHASFMGALKRDDQVIDYDPVQGFRLVPRVPSDEDVIRRPRGVHVKG